MRMVCKGFLLAAGLVVAFVVPASAAASLGSVYGDYTSHRTIDACKYSAADLQHALGSVPTDIQQYDPGFVDALNKALANRSGCSSGGGRQSAGAGAAGSGSKPRATAADGSPKPGGTPVSVVPASTRPVSSSGGFPLAFAILLGAIVLGAAGVTATRRYGWPPVPLRRTLY